ncbi:hypothetical protein Goshw_019784 [Gossypium schwendimanii]|uniref:Succinate dehydrogenase subunit 6, mitochondrial n=7 Tax=Gossypium TaxID=3633 RepID=A0A9D3W7G7_9ROSI|nr:succinate dehydrogenase subunit 6, mitochondrial [Gossypium raimondii]XP_040955285.1 succinate dehydrogenase subunit 6, mitochondrial [Gossypium hirsutum]KAH1108940.1 hypothetical protein J1N35_012708 [Gossypium stocksii]MBA0795197.1 hypothetical protein [Gossypium harknessii]MBA0853606.1 hypothetical protein [Gossypium schwendimanii]TYH56348.1 hypothetical protein ES332_D08G012000v1 [Gossypium tomentosum]TYI67345.1 hypothetical protein E1A91_D08G011600v1 [Gossypium mustelinum]
MEDSSSKSFLRKQWDEYKEFWADRFPFTNVYSRYIGREQSLPSWSESDVNEFIASDPVHGPTLKTAREAANIALYGSAIGAITTAGFAWKYSKSLHGAGLSFVGGAVFGWTFGQEIANHAYQLYRLDTMAAQAKFMDWWENKCRR